MPLHNCKYCEYTTDRKSNLDRHCIRKHSEELIHEMRTPTIPQNVHQYVTPVPQNVNVSPQNVNKTTQNVNVSPQNVNQCTGCHKVFRDNYALSRHSKACKGLRESTQCKYCLKIFGHRQSLHTHLKICSEKQKQTLDSNILVFPDSLEDTDFEFFIDHISITHIRAIAHETRDNLSFLKFCTFVLSYPKNLLIRKNSPNVNYSMIHVGNDVWEYIIDDYAYQNIIHFLTISALKVISNVKNHVLKSSLEHFRNFAFSLNTDIDSNMYKDIEYQMKLVIINITKRKE